MSGSTACLMDATDTVRSGDRAAGARVKSDPSSIEQSRIQPGGVRGKV
jgi:hypothetical protein